MATFPAAMAKRVATSVRARWSALRHGAGEQGRAWPSPGALAALGLWPKSRRRRASQRM